MENGIFHCLVEERKQERQKIGGKIFPLGAPFFILPIWKENEERKVLKDALYTNTLNLSCIFFSFFSLHWAVTLPLFLPFFFFFWGNNGANNVALFFFLGQSCFQLSLFFFLGINIASFYFFLFFFSFDFLGLGHDSLFLFLLDVIFFET